MCEEQRVQMGHTTDLVDVSLARLTSAHDLVDVSLARLVDVSLARLVDVSLARLTSLVLADAVEIPGELNVLLEDYRQLNELLDFLIELLDFLVELLDALAGRLEDPVALSR